MSDAIDAIELALSISGLSQKELAVQLGVSPTQISKWKKGEHMSFEMEDRIKALIKIGDLSPSVVRWAGSIKDAKKWEGLFHYLARCADENGETGYDTYPLKDEMGLMSWSTIHVLNQIGVEPPKKFPKELESYKADSIEWDILEKNQYFDLVYKIYSSLTDVYGFYVAYISELIDDDLIGTDADNIEPCLMELAASKVSGVDVSFAPKFGNFRYEVRKNYTKWLTLVKDRSFRAGAPLRAELMDMVSADHEELGHEAEAESFGFNSARLHPDIYMNEILCGMRTIHQILPFIMKKLGIYDEFKLDGSQLRSRD